MLTLNSVLTARPSEPVTPTAIRELGPFCNRDRHASGPGAPGRGEAAPVFYVDIDRGVRFELTLPEPVAGLTPDALLMPRPDGGWDVFEADGLLVTYESDVIHVSLCR